MSYTIPMDKIELVQATPDPRTGPGDNEPNPVLPDVIAHKDDGQWWCYKGLTTANNQEVHNHRDGQTRKVSQLHIMTRMLRRAVNSLNMGLDTRTQDGAKKGTVDLYWKVRPKRVIKRTTKQADE